MLLFCQLKFLAQARGLVRAALRLGFDGNQPFADGVLHRVESRRAGLEVRRAVHRLDDAVFHLVEGFFPRHDVRVKSGEPRFRRFHLFFQQV